MHLFLCEKPDQAGKLAKVLGGARLAAGKTHWETNGGWVTWALGHLLETCKPDKLDTRWGSPWRLEQLPMLPPKMQYVPAADKQERLKAIGSLLERCDEVFIATDGGTEGEMIGREILDLYRFTGPVNRVWLSALTPVAIQKALDNTLPGDKTIGYYHSALGRSHADWLIGMNGTRVLSCRTPAGSGTISLGRVQTPTVAIVVWRDREIANFKARDYYEVVATVRIAGAAKTVALRHAPKPNIFDRGVADHLAAVARGATQPLTVVSEKGKQSQPPAPFELNTLTKTASRLWRWSAKKTLSVAQSLYETHTAITYPRTDCKYLTDDARSEVPVLTRLLLALPEFA
jgi:DNA topoisomerase-3